MHLQQGPVLTQSPAVQTMQHVIDCSCNSLPYSRRAHACAAATMTWIGLLSMPPDHETCPSGHDCERPPFAFFLPGFARHVCTRRLGMSAPRRICLHNLQVGDVAFHLLFCFYSGACHNYPFGAMHGRLLPGNTPLELSPLVSMWLW